MQWVPGSSVFKAKYYNIFSSTYQITWANGCFSINTKHLLRPELSAIQSLLQHIHVPTGKVEHFPAASSSAGATDWESCQDSGEANCPKYRISSKSQVLPLKIPTSFIFYSAESLVLVYKCLFQHRKWRLQALPSEQLLSKSLKVYWYLL